MNEFISEVAIVFGFLFLVALLGFIAWRLERYRRTLQNYKKWHGFIRRPGGTGSGYFGDGEC